VKQVIIRNAAECAVCHELIESVHIHDFQSCTSGHIYIDGGKNYLRRGGKLEYIIDRSEVEYHPLDKWLSKRILAHLTSGTDWKKAIPQMIRGALAYEAVFHVKKALDEIPEIHALDCDVRLKIEKAIQKEFIGET
jgi:hypothetical protein